MAESVQFYRAKTVQFSLAVTAFLFEKFAAALEYNIP